MGDILTRVLARLHLAVDHPGIIPLPVDVVHLRQVGCILGGRNLGQNRFSETDYQLSLQTSLCCDVHHILHPNVVKQLLKSWELLKSAPE